MSNREKAGEYLRVLQEQRRAYEAFAEERVIPLFMDNDQRERRPPQHFKDSSFLYIRSHDGDIGSRPISNQVFWLSPDILISPVSGPSTYTRTLVAGRTYNIVCQVHNRGDLVVPSAKVEFWLVDPSLGFNTRFAKNLTLGAVPSIWVNPDSTVRVSITYTVPPTEAGHKCLFARVFSFSPLDIPVDDYRLDPTLDRHIGQQNLDIVQQGQPYLFNWIHAPNADEVIEFVPMSPAEVIALRHPILADVAPIPDFPAEHWVQMSMVKLADTDAREVDVSGDNNSLQVMSRDPEGIDASTWGELRVNVKNVLAAIDAGQTRMMEHKNLFSSFRQANNLMRRSIFRMQVPDLGLRDGQVVGIHIRSIGTLDSGAPEILGGITLLVVA